MPAPGRQVHLLQMGGCGFRRFRPRYRRCLNQAGTPCRTSNALFDWKEPAMPTSWSSADLLLPKGWSVVALGFVTLAFAFTVRGSLSLAMPLWQADFGWSRRPISSIAAAASLVMPPAPTFPASTPERPRPP